MYIAEKVRKPSLWEQFPVAKELWEYSVRANCFPRLRGCKPFVYFLQCERDRERGGRLTGWINLLQLFVDVLPNCFDHCHLWISDRNRGNLIRCHLEWLVCYQGCGAKRSKNLPRAAAWLCKVKVLDHFIPLPLLLWVQWLWESCCRGLFVLLVLSEEDFSDVLTWLITFLEATTYSCLFCFHYQVDKAAIIWGQIMIDVCLSMCCVNCPIYTM